MIFSEELERSVSELNTSIDEEENILALEAAKAMLKVLEKRTCNGTYDELILKTFIIFDKFEDDIKAQIFQKMEKMGKIAV